MSSKLTVPISARVPHDIKVIPEPYKEDDGLDLSNFLEACDSKGVKPQDAINKAAQMVWRG